MRNQEKSKEEVADRMSEIEQTWLFFRMQRVMIPENESSIHEQSDTYVNMFTRLQENVTFP